MKRNIVFSMLIAMVTVPCFSQVGRYDTPAKSNYFNTNVGTDWGSLLQMYNSASSIQHRNAQIADYMINAVYELKAEITDVAFKKKIDGYLEQLKKIRLGNLLGDTEVQLKKIDWAIRDEVEKYYSAVSTTSSNTTPSRTNTNAPTIYSAGNYVETTASGILRSEPSVNATELERISKPIVVKILKKINDVFYEVEAGNIKGYISRAYLERQVSSSAYLAYQKSSRPNHTVINYDSEYDRVLLANINEFKANGFKDFVRSSITENLTRLSSQLENAKMSSNVYSEEYNSLEGTQMKLKSFSSFLNLFTRQAGNMCDYEEFIYAMAMLDVSPHLLPHLKCEMVSFYEVYINGLRAIVARSHYSRVEQIGSPIVEVTYFINDQGEIIRGGSFNLGSNRVRSVKYLSDSNSNYPAIISVQCTRMQ